MGVRSVMKFWCMWVLVALCLLVPQVSAGCLAGQISDLRKKEAELKPAQFIRLMEQERVLIPDNGNLSWFDKLYNQLTLDVFHEKRKAEEVRVNGQPLMWYAAGKGLHLGMHVHFLAGAQADVFLHGETMMHRAVLSGNKDSALYLENNRKLLYSSPYCRSAWKGVCGMLKRAAQGGDVATLQHVYGEVKDVVYLGKNHMSVIDNACMAGHTKAFDYLLSKGWDVRLNEVLLRAARSGRLPLVRELVSKGACAHYVGTAGYTPLMTAAQSGDTDLVKFLLKQEGVDVNARTRLGNTALLFAARSGNVNMVSDLMEKKADPDVESAASGNLVANAAASGDFDTLTKAMRLCRGNSIEKANIALCHAARYGHMDMVVKLMEQFTLDVNTVQTVRVQHVFPYEDLEGHSGVVEVEETTPLMAAVASGHVAMVQYLVTMGADVDKTVGKKEFLLSPQRAAARRGQPDILAFLLDRSQAPEPDARLLHDAVQNGNLACAQLLVKRGWDVNAVDEHTGLTPVQAACLRGTEAPGSVCWTYDTGNYHAVCIKYLMEQGADLMGVRGKKAKMLALHQEVPLFEAAAVVWNSGAGLSAREMLYPLHRAAEFGLIFWIKELSRGLKAQNPADLRKSPLFTICNSGDSYLPYKDGDPREIHRYEHCANILASYGALLTKENSRFLVRHRVHKRFYRHLVPEIRE